MNDARQPHEDREAPPFVLATLMRVGAGVEDAVRRLIVSIPLRVRIFLWAAGTLVMFLTILSLSVAQAPGWQGILRGVLGGGFIALLFAAGMGWLLLWAREPRSRARPESGAGVDALNTLLGPTLRELNAVRADVVSKVSARSVVRVPIGIAGAFVFWLVAQGTDDPPSAFELLLFLVTGAVAGEVWAFHKLEREYQRLYKSRVLPILASRFGALTYKEATADDVHKLRAFRILPEFDSVSAEDEISGTHRGLGIRIIEARLQCRSGDDTRTVFDGLLIEIRLPRNLTGTTVVLADEGMFGNLKARWQSGAMEPVRLEDPRFEKRFEVYSDDQIEARALLTPAFMERFTALAATSAFSLPGALAEGNRLFVALPKTMGTRDLFEPPAYWKPAGGYALLTLEQDIRAVLDMAETVVALDFFAASRSTRVT